jgi:hypothetical protein
MERVIWRERKKHREQEKKMKTMWGLLALALLAAPVRADRTPSVRSQGQRDNGTRTDITVPYLTTGNSAFGAYRVAPRIYSSPTADDPAKQGAKPAYNLPFYSGRMGFGTGSNGAVPKPTLLPSQAK